MKLIIFVKSCILLSLLININCSEAHSEGKDKNQIFISEKNMKKAKHLLKENPNAISPTSSQGSVNDNIGKPILESTNILSKAGFEKVPTSEDVNIGNGPIFFSGWVKYFKYSEVDMATTKAPKHFFQNNAFYEQSKYYPNVDMNSTDTDGKATYIRDKAFFWLMVFADTINFVSSKQVIFI